jgi:hypothetical protein
VDQKTLPHSLSEAKLRRAKLKCEKMGQRFFFKTLFFMNYISWVVGLFGGPGGHMLLKGWLGIFLDQ